MGYHLNDIPKGELGKSDKILEEVLELQDAEAQGVRVMALCELADLYGAIEHYLLSNFPDITMEDLRQMSAVTSRAFQSGRRT
jgi:hypothetical protein